MIPKFRAWDKLNKRFVKISDFYLDTDGSIKEIGTELLDFGNDPSFDSVVLMQSTGLKDKNGVEIYQDDVVNMCWSDEIGESHWGKITIKNPFDYCIEEARYLIHADELEVIGNIYENPELLEGDKA